MYTWATFFWLIKSFWGASVNHPFLLRTDFDKDNAIEQLLFTKRLQHKSLSCIPIMMKQIFKLTPSIFIAVISRQCAKLSGDCDPNQQLKLKKIHITMLQYSFFYTELNLFLQKSLDFKIGQQNTSKKVLFGIWVFSPLFAFTLLGYHLITDFVHKKAESCTLMKDIWQPFSM